MGEKVTQLSSDSNIEQSFTLQEHRIAFLLVQRKSDEEICIELCIGMNTTRMWLKRIYQKYEIEGVSRGKRLVAADSYSKYVARSFIEVR